MSKRGDKELLNDIREAIHRIKKYTKGMNYKQFLGSSITQDAVLRNIEIIGEAVKNLSKHLKDKYKEIEWKDIAGMRDKIIHFYFGVNWEIVWSVLNDRLPELLKKIEIVIKNLEKKR